MFSTRMRYWLLLSLSVLVLTVTGCGKADEIGQKTDIDSASASEAENSNCGVLLGLKVLPAAGEDRFQNPPQYQTLWIWRQNGQVDASRTEGYIVVPYGRDFYYLRNNSFFNEKKVSDAEGNNGYLDYEYSHRYLYISACLPDERLKKSSVNPFVSGDSIDDWPYSSGEDEIMYAGNKFVLIRNTSFETGGGTYSSSWFSNYLYDIASLQDRTKTYLLKDYVSGDLKKELQPVHSQYDAVIEQSEADPGMEPLMITSQFIDEEKMTLLHQRGHWQISVPLVEEYVHNGNGSVHTSEKRYMPVQSLVKSDLLTHDALLQPYDEIARVVPGAKDAVMSPDGTLTAVMTENFLLVFNGKITDKNDPVLTIPIKSGSLIVANQWATGGYTAAWTASLKDAFVSAAEKNN